MPSIASDTHAAIWYLTDSPRLSDRARNAFAETTEAGYRTYLPSSCMVEAQYLAERGRIDATALQRLVRAVSQSVGPFFLFPLNLAVSLAITAIPRAIVPEMPDRIIAATARYLGVPLVTRDHEIRATDVETIL